MFYYLDLKKCNNQSNFAVYLGLEGDGELTKTNNLVWGQLALTGICSRDLEYSVSNGKNDNKPCVSCTPVFIAALFTIARTWKQLRCPSTDEWRKKQWYIYTMEYYSVIKRNSFESALMRWMTPEPIIQSEVSQKEKSQHHAWNLERWYWWAYFHSSSGDVDIENRLMDTGGGKEGKGGMYGESNTEIYITICKIDSEWEFAVWLKELKPGLCQHLERWDGVGGGRQREGTYMYLWLIHVDVWQKSMQYCKAIILQLKIDF